MGETYLIRRMSRIITILLQISLEKMLKIIGKTLIAVGMQERSYHERVEREYLYL